VSAGARAHRSVRSRRTSLLVMDRRRPYRLDSPRNW
jgi:hypothetical protein